MPVAVPIAYRHYRHDRMKQFIHYSLQTRRCPKLPEQYLVDQTHNRDINRNRRERSAIEFSDAQCLQRKKQCYKQVGEDRKETEKTHNVLPKGQYTVVEHQQKLSDDRKPAHCGKYKGQ